MHTIIARLERFRKKLASIADPAADPVEYADIVATIADLEAKIAAAPPAGDTITVGDITRSHAVAVGTGARALVYIDGRQGKTDDELLVAYYQHLSRRCGSVPLQGVYEQRTTSDSLTMGLRQVYTQLATTAEAQRERLDRAALGSFDAAAFLSAHTGTAILPAQQRRSLLVASDTSTAEGRSMALGALPSLDGMSPDDLARLVADATSVTFIGPQLVSEAIAENPCMVLLGEPGSGKSTAMRHLALSLAEAGLDPQCDLGALLDGWGLGRLLPIFAPLLPLARRLAEDPTLKGNAEDLWGYLADHLQPKGANAGLATAVHSEIDAGRVILLLDGLDEVAGADSRHKVVRAVRAFASEHPRCRIVVACRVRAYEGERNAKWQLPGWPTATLADWTLGQMTTFVRAWYHTVAALQERSEVWLAERIAKLTLAISTRQDLQRFGRQPLMMTIMALVHLNDGRLPEERASLYGRCIDILLGQWEVAGKDDSEYGTLMDYVGLPDADVNSLRPLLAKAAYEAHNAVGKDEVGRLSRALLRTMVDDELKQRRHPNPSAGADKFLVYTDVRAGLIQASDAGDEYAFPHQTFQEYLAGIELVSGGRPELRILALRNDDRWRRPILLGIEQLALTSLAVPYHILSRLIDTRERRDLLQRSFDLHLAVEIADDLGWAWLEKRDSLFGGLKEQLALGLAATLGEPSIPARDLVRAGAALATLGDPRPGVCDLPPAMVKIAGGSFTPGSSKAEADAAGRAYEAYYLKRGEKDRAKSARDWPKDEIHDRAVDIPAFDLARYPITNAQYALFIDAGGYDPTADWWGAAARAWLARDDAATKGLEAWQRRTHKEQPEWWDDPTFGSARPNHPLVGVSWYEATAFCRWLTENRTYNLEGYAYALPSEAEWEYAARGQGRRMYAWGDEAPDAEWASYDQTYGVTTLAVGCFPRGATPEGILDLTGGVWEWTRSVYQPYPYDPADGREGGSDPANKRFTLRGGAWNNQPISLRAAYRYCNSPDYLNRYVGFRLLRRPGA